MFYFPISLSFLSALLLFYLSKENRWAAKKSHKQVFKILCVLVLVLSVILSYEFLGNVAAIFTIVFVFLMNSALISFVKSINYKKIGFPLLLVINLIVDVTVFYNANH